MNEIEHLKNIKARLAGLPTGVRLGLITRLQNELTQSQEALVAWENRTFSLGSMSHHYGHLMDEATPLVVAANRLKLVQIHSPGSEYEAPRWNTKSIQTDFDPFVLMAAEQDVVIERATAEKTRVLAVAKSLEEDAKHVAQAIEKGKTCKVVRGRKIKVGTVVSVIGVPKEDNYGRIVVLVKLPDNSMVNTSIENLEVALDQTAEAA